MSYQEQLNQFIQEYAGGYKASLDAVLRIIQAVTTRNVGGIQAEDLALLAETTGLTDRVRSYIEQTAKDSPTLDSIAKIRSILGSASVLATAALATPQGAALSGMMRSSYPQAYDTLRTAAWEFNQGRQIVSLQNLRSIPALWRESAVRVYRSFGGSDSAAAALESAPVELTEGLFSAANQAAVDELLGVGGQAAGGAAYEAGLAAAEAGLAGEAGLAAGEAGAAAAGLSSEAIAGMSAATLLGALGASVMPLATVAVLTLEYIHSAMAGSAPGQLTTHHSMTDEQRDALRAWNNRMHLLAVSNGWSYTPNEHLPTSWGDIKDENIRARVQHAVQEFGNSGNGVSGDDMIYMGETWVLDWDAVYRNHMSDILDTATEGMAKDGAAFLNSDTNASYLARARVDAILRPITPRPQPTIDPETTRPVSRDIENEYGTTGYQYQMVQAITEAGLKEGWTSRPKTQDELDYNNRLISDAYLARTGHLPPTPTANATIDRSNGMINQLYEETINRLPANQREYFQPRPAAETPTPRPTTDTPTPRPTTETPTPRPTTETPTVTLTATPTETDAPTGAQRPQMSGGGHSRNFIPVEKSDSQQTPKPYTGVYTGSVYTPTPVKLRFDMGIARALFPFASAAYDDENGYKTLCRRFNPETYGSISTGTSVTCYSSSSSVIVAFRGTTNKREMAVDLMVAGGMTAPHTNIRDELARDLHSGFLAAYLTLRPHVTKFLGKHNGKRVYLTGHSLGGAMATIASIDITGCVCCTFGAPRISGSKVVNEISMREQRGDGVVFRLFNLGDPVSYVPRLNGYTPLKNTYEISTGVARAPDQTPYILPHRLSLAAHGRDQYYQSLHKGLSRDTTLLFGRQQKHFDFDVFQLGKDVSDPAANKRKRGT